jgi:hypothetical protein
MPEGFSPWQPEGLRQSRPGERDGPDPEPILRRVLIIFALAGMLAAAMVTVGLNPVGYTSRMLPPQSAVTATMAVVLVAILGLGWRNLRPRRLLSAGKRWLEAADPAERAPRAEKARAMGFAGLALSWSMQAIALAELPVLTGLLLKLLHGQVWPLLAFGGLGVGAGVVYQRSIAAAVRLAVDDPELRSAYGSR